MIPCIGAGITVALPKKWSEGERSRKLRRAYVTGHGPWVDQRGGRIDWKSGPLTGEVWENEEGIEWIVGHGPQAIAALQVARAL